MTIDAAELARLRRGAERASFAVNWSKLIALDIIDELEKARIERDSARALLRDLVKLIDWTIGPELRARIAAALGDKP